MISRAWLSLQFAEPGFVVPGERMDPMAQSFPPVEEYDEEDAYDRYNSQIDTGFHGAPTQRISQQGTSARRYPHPATTTLRKASQSAVPTRSRAGYDAKTRDYNEMGDDEVRYGSNFARRTTGSRPRTDEDKQITTRIKRDDVPPRGVSRRGLIAGGVGLLLTGIIGGNAAVNMIHDWQLRWAQGPYPVRPVELVCGHGDSAARPTLLHVFIESYTIVSLETPGGNHGKDHVVTGIGLPTTGDVSKWDLEVVPVRVGSKQYQIEITVTGVSGTGQSFVYHWLLVDSGKGYFVGVK